MFVQYSDKIPSYSKALLILCAHLSKLYTINMCMWVLWPFVDYYQIYNTNAREYKFSLLVLTRITQKPFVPAQKFWFYHKDQHRQLSYTEQISSRLHIRLSKSAGYKNNGNYIYHFVSFIYLGE